MRIVIDAGHSFSTPGKRSPDGSLREYQFNSVTAGYVSEMLRQFENVEVLRTDDPTRDVPLKERTDRANAWNADLFISIHANAAGDGVSWHSAQGIETYVYISRPPDAVALANAVQRNLVRLTGRPDRGVKSADFHVLRETKMTAILVECGFMTNREECELLKSDAYRRKCAGAIVAGIVETYGLKKKTSVETEKSKETNLLQRIAELEKELERIPAPQWFVKEFGSADLGGLIHEPAFTAEGWRTLAVALRAQGKGDGVKK